MDGSLFDLAGRELQSWSRTLILAHDRPDGDAIGALVAIKRILLAQGRTAEAYLFQQQVAPRYRFLSEVGDLRSWPADPSGLESKFDGVIVLDTSSWSQLGPAAAFLQATRLPKIIIDHHATRDDLKGQSPRLVGVIDETSASACGLIVEWAERMGWTLDAQSGEALFAGLATDTGWFRFSNSDGRALRAAAKLIEAGVRPDVMYGRLYEGHRAARLRLLREALDTLRILDDGHIAVMWLTRPMFILSDALPSDSEDMVNEPLIVGSVIVSILLSEMDDGPIRVNFRSRSPEVAGRDIDVSAIARQFGGGGHRRAAGARISGSLDEVREQAVAAVRAALTNA